MALNKRFESSITTTHSFSSHSTTTTASPQPLEFKFEAIDGSWQHIRGVKVLLDLLKHVNGNNNNNNNNDNDDDDIKEDDREEENERRSPRSTTPKHPPLPNPPSSSSSHYHHPSSHHHSHHHHESNTKKSASHRICSVYSIPGHLALLLDDYKLLCLFDSVKAGSVRLTDTQEEVLYKDIMGTLEENINPVSDVLLQKYPVKVVLVRFQNAGPVLHLIVLLEIGSVDIWEWVEQNKWMWHLKVRVSLVESRPSIVAAGYTSSSVVVHSKEQNNNNNVSNNANINNKEKHYLFWVERQGSWNNSTKTGRSIYKLVLSQFKMSPEGKVIQAPNSPSSRELETLTDHIDRCYHGVNGFWLLTEKLNKIFFWYFPPRILYHVQLNNVPNLERVVVLFSVSHPITNEVVLITEDAKILACAFSTKLSAVRVVHLSTMKNCNVKGVIQVDIMHHLLILYYRLEAKIYELRSGALVGVASLPFNFSSPPQDHLWNQAKRGDMPNGIWNYEGFYHLKCRSITEVAQQIAQDPQNLKYSAKLCKDWGLTRWHTKYLLDIVSEAQQKGSYEEVLSACAALLPSFQNPSLILYVLSQYNILPSFMVDELENFLKKVKGIDTISYSQHNTTTSSTVTTTTTTRSREAARIAFHYSTPLNTTLIPVLSSYLDLRGTPDKTVQEKEYSTNQIIQSLSNDEVLKLSQTKLDIYSEIQPEIMLNKLQQALGIRLAPSSLSYDTSPVSLPSVGEETLPGGPNANHRQVDEAVVGYFEVLVKLYYKVSPDYLVSFVESVRASHIILQPMQQEPSFYQRALDVLPPLEDTTEHQFESRVMCRVSLLEKVGDFAQGLKLLLFLGRDDHYWWQKSLQFVRKQVEYKVEKGELFGILLTHCLRSPPPPPPPPSPPSPSSPHQFTAFYTNKEIYQHLDYIWEFLPPKLSALDIVSMFQISFPPPIDSSSGSSSIGSSSSSSNSNRISSDGSSSTQPNNSSAPPVSTTESTTTIMTTTTTTLFSSKPEDVSCGILAPENKLFLGVLKTKLLSMIEKEKKANVTLE